jgi:hypothetical protein
MALPLIQSYWQLHKPATTTGLGENEYEEWFPIKFPETNNQPTSFSLTMVQCPLSQLLVNILQNVGPNAN